VLRVLLPKETDPGNFGKKFTPPNKPHHRGSVQRIVILYDVGK
jgi:hypothetical protein